MDFFGWLRKDNGGFWRDFDGEGRGRSLKELRENQRRSERYRKVSEGVSEEIGRYRKGIFHYHQFKVLKSERIIRVTKLRIMGSANSQRKV